MIIIAIILLILGGFSKSVMDKLADGKWDFIYYNTTPYNHVKWTKWFEFKQNTWKNKYKNNDPRQGEKFPLSTTALVFLTDGWHFFQMLTYTFLIIGVILMYQSLEWLSVSWYYYSLLVFIISKGIFTISFQLFYKKLKIMKKLHTGWRILIFLLLYNGIVGIPYFFDLHNLIKFSNMFYGAEIIVGGILALVGFIYGVSNIKK